MNITAIPSDTLADADLDRVIDLKRLVWPDDLSTEQHRALFRGKSAERRGRVTYLVELDGRLVGHAELFSREIEHADGRMEISAIAGVCVDPATQGSGLGKQLAIALFNDAPKTLLFQTGVPGFYEKLGARLVTNRFVRGADDPRNPWNDDFVMIFPADAPWPDGAINLLGEGY